MELIEPPDHSVITRRIQRIRNYLKSIPATGQEASSEHHREKNEPALRQGQREVTSEYDTRWQNIFEQFSDYVQKKR